MFAIEDLSEIADSIVQQHQFSFAVVFFSDPKNPDKLFREASATALSLIGLRKA